MHNITKYFIHFHIIHNAHDGYSVNDYTIWTTVRLSFNDLCKRISANSLNAPSNCRHTNLYNEKALPMFHTRLHFCYPFPRPRDVGGVALFCRASYCSRHIRTSRITIASSTSPLLAIGACSNAWSLSARSCVFPSPSASSTLRKTRTFILLSGGTTPPPNP